jgi:hypothetical protein
MPVYSFALKIGGVDVTTYGVIVSDLPNNWDAPAISYPEVQIPGRRGTVRTSAKRQYAPTDYVVKGNLIGTSPSDFESKRDALHLATLGDAVLIGGNQTARQRTGSVSSIQYPQLYPSAAQAPILITVHCEDPIAYATSATTVTGSSGSDLACAVGSEDSYPVVTATSPTSPLVITYKNHAGTTIATATITFPGSPATIVVDMLLQRVTAAGVRHDEYLTAGDFFALSPVDAVGGSPTVRISSGSASIVYTQAFR